MSKPIQHEENIGNRDEMIETEVSEQRLPVKLTEADRLERGDVIARAQEQIEQLPVKLTEADRLERGDVIARAQEQIEQLEEKKKTVNEEIKAELSTLEGTVRLNARELRKGTTDKNVVVHTIKNFRTGTITKKRTDTDEVLHERPMTEPERQLGLHIPPA